MAHEENIDGAGVEFDDHAPDNRQPHVLDAVVFDAVAEEPLAVIVEEPAAAAVEEPAPVAAAAAAASAPDFYAVGVRLIKMSPVWLLTVTGGFALLILLLSWVRPAGGEVDAASIPNDAKSVVVQYPEAPTSSAAKPTQETPAPVSVPAKEERAEVPAEAKPAEPAQAQSAPRESHEAMPVESQKEPARVAPSSNDSGGKFTVQVGSFSVESQANERISSLRAAGFDARSTAVEIPGRGKWYRVHVGRFAEREDAAKVSAQMREKGAASGSMVVPVQ
jgi:cell division septation protein DedD